MQPLPPQHLTTGRMTLIQAQKTDEAFTLRHYARVCRQARVRLGRNVPGTSLLLRVQEWGV